MLAYLDDLENWNCSRKRQHCVGFVILLNMIGIILSKKIDSSLAVSQFNDAYGRYFGRDDYGNITACQFKIWLANLDFNVANRKIKVVEDIKDQERSRRLRLGIQKT